VSEIKAANEPPAAVIEDTSISLSATDDESPPNDFKPQVKTVPFFFIAANPPELPVIEVISVSLSATGLPP